MPFVASAVASLVSAIGGAIAKLTVDKVLMFVALKVLLTTLFIVVLPIILNNVWHDFLQMAISSVNGVDVTNISGYGSMSFTGFLGYLIDCFRIPEVLAVVIGAFQLHITFKMIPFSPIK